MHLNTLFCTLTFVLYSCIATPHTSTLEDKDNILFYGQYKEFINEYNKKDYYENLLKTAKEKMDVFEKEFKLAVEKLEKDSTSLLSV